MKPFMAIVVLLCLLGVTRLNATIAHEPQQRSDRRCRGNTDLVGECFEFHGRMFVSNGTPGVRIWPVGTKRLLGVLPLVFATGAGQEARHSVGTAVAGGMVVSTFLNIIFIPVLYVVIETVREQFTGAPHRAADADA